MEGATNCRDLVCSLLHSVLYGLVMWCTTVGNIGIGWSKIGV